MFAEVPVQGSQSHFGETLSEVAGGGGGLVERLCRPPGDWGDFAVQARGRWRLPQLSPSGLHLFRNLKSLLVPWSPLGFPKGAARVRGGEGIWCLGSRPGG